MSFDHDFSWQRSLIPEIKRICANYLIGEAPMEEDIQRNTDLIVLRLEPVRVACRLRRHKYARGQYLDEFTVRSGRPRSPHLIEHAKIISGWGDYFFYGFASDDEASLAAWFLGDLNVFRLWHGQQLALGRQPWCDERTNGDNSSTFKAFCIDHLPPDFVVARQRLTVTDNERTWELF